MLHQLALPLSLPVRTLRPKPTATAPLWIRELQVLRALEPGDQALVRRIPLRPGLNILWARVPQEGGAEFEAGLSGHAAGKTTFCRLLRYALGEAHFGNDALRRDMRLRFPEGWMVAEVQVRGEPWVVCRPFAVGPHPFVLRGRVLEDLWDPAAEREEFAVYQRALDGLLVDEVGEPFVLPSSRELTFAHALQWLARDQECRLSDAMAFRDPSSESGSPQLDTAERQFLVRSLLGLLSPLESRELAKHEALLQRRRELRERVPLLRHQAEIDRQRLADALGTALPDFEGGLFREVVRRALQDREAHIVLSRQHLPELPTPLPREWPPEAEVSAPAELPLPLFSEDARAEAEPGAESAARIACGVSLAAAQAAGCPLHPRPTRAPAAKGRGAAPPNLATTQQAARDAAIWRIALAEAELLRLRTLAEHAEGAYGEAAGLERSLEELDSAIERSYQIQEALREQQARTLAQLSGLYELVFRGLLGDAVGAGLELSGRNLLLRLTFHGERHSAALDTLKIIALDLMALTTRVEGQGHFPGLLIHDGPREADMSPDLYRRIFLYALRLEQSVGERPPPFQYIITTTEPPPRELRRAPFLVLPPLDAARPEGRLLGVNL